MLRRIQALPWIHTAYDIAIVVLMVWLALRYEDANDWFIGVAMALALAFRRRRPMAVMGLVSGLGLIQYALASVPASYDLALIVAMVSVVTHSPRMWQHFTAGGIVLLGSAMALGAHEALIDMIALEGVCAAVWLTATAMRTVGCTRRAWRPGPPPPNGNVSTWCGSRPPRSARRSPGSCTTWWPTVWR